MNSDREHAWAGHLPPRSILLDLFERSCVLVLFCWFAYANLSYFRHSFDVRSLMLLISETLPVVLIILRPPSATLSTNPFDWLVGLLGSSFPLFIRIGGKLAPLVSLQVCFALIIAGIFIQLMAKLALGRSFGLIAANRGVKSSGLYRFVRHPIYAGYLITHVGIFLSTPSLRNALIYAAFLALLFIRILREERVLRLDERYRAFAESVPYYLIPGVF
jgi:protein-S-isoprenylcysteine O-methyltransferase Ste14